MTANKIIKYIYFARRVHTTRSTHRQTDRHASEARERAKERTRCEFDSSTSSAPGVCVLFYLFIIYLSRWICSCSFSGDFHVVVRTHEKRNECVLIRAIDLKCQARIWTNFRDSMFSIRLRVKHHWIGATGWCLSGFQNDYDWAKPHTPMESSVFFN